MQTEHVLKTFKVPKDVAIAFAVHPRCADSKETIAGINVIMDYCEIAGILPEDLIAFHREHSKSILKRKLKAADGKETKILKESKHLNWRENLTKKKTGQ